MTAGVGSLSGRGVLVTGGSGGIGSAIASRCAAAGAVVGVGFHRNEAAARAVVDAIVERGGRAISVALDVTDPASAKAGVDAMVAVAAGLDALVSCAGVVATGLLVSADGGDLRRLVDVNVLGPLVCARAALPAMLGRRKGVIVLVGSVAASRPSRGQAAYVATKGSVEALARALAVEYGRKGIRAVCVRPGAIDTAMLRPTLALGADELLSRIPARRLGAPAEVAEVVAFALGDGASYVNGAVLDVDGGYAAQ